MTHRGPLDNELVLRKKFAKRLRGPVVRGRHRVVERCANVTVEESQQEGSPRDEHARELAQDRREARQCRVDDREPREDAPNRPSCDGQPGKVPN